ncbi:hypothetical protein HK096_003566 [Nowakowskiella sp. JEL0078]|nr:hypothetical protein HK096_003566 [Nowakowskiella sp. JEL0078]
MNNPTHDNVDPNITSQQTGEVSQPLQSQQLPLACDPLDHHLTAHSSPAAEPFNEGIAVTPSYASQAQLTQLDHLPQQNLPQTSTQQILAIQYQQHLAYLAQQNLPQNLANQAQHNLPQMAAQQNLPQIFPPQQNVRFPNRRSIIFSKNSDIPVALTSVNQPSSSIPLSLSLDDQKSLANLCHRIFQAEFVTQDPTGEICAICCDPLERRGGIPIINPGCGHELHFTCLQRAITFNLTTCCICRKSFNASLLSQVSFQQQALANPLNLDASIPTINFGGLNAGRNRPSNLPRPVLMDDELPTLTSLVAVIDNSVNNLVSSDVDMEDVSSSSIEISDATESHSQIMQPEISMKTEYPEIPTTSTNVVSVLTVTAPNVIQEIGTGDNSETTQGMDLIGVVDISGSMAGSKLNFVKTTLKYAVNQLTHPRDRVCIIGFDTTADLISPFVTVNSATGKNRLNEAIDSMNSRGGTFIGSGLALAMQRITNRRSSNPVTAVILFTDGQDNNRNDYSEVSLQFQNMSIPIHSFGYGSDHDADTLTAISGLAGSFTYIEQASIIQDAIAGCLGAIKSSLFENIHVSLSIPENIGKITRISTPFTKSVSPDGLTGSVDLPNLFSNEKREILFELALNSVPQNLSDQHILSAHSIFTPIGESPRPSDPTIFTINRKEFADFPVAGVHTANLTITRQRIRTDVEQGLREAVAFADNRNFGQAQARIAELRAKIENAKEIATVQISNDSTNSLAAEVLQFLIAMEHDINVSARRTTDVSSYSSGGRQYTMMNVQQQSAQRSVYSSLESRTSAFGQTQQMFQLQSNSESSRIR